MFDNYLKIQILLHADDTVIFSETPEGLQKSLSLFGRILQMLEIKYKYRKKQKLSFFQRLDTEVILTLN